MSFFFSDQYNHKEVFSEAPSLAHQLANSGKHLQPVGEYPFLLDSLRHVWLKAVGKKVEVVHWISK